METKDLIQIKEKYKELLRDLHENIRADKVEHIRLTINDLIKKAFLLKRKLEMNQ